MYQGLLLGALNLGRGVGNSLTSEEAEIYHDVANQLAIAIQRINLYNALQSELAERKNSSPNWNPITLNSSASLTPFRMTCATHV